MTESTQQPLFQNSGLDNEPGAIKGGKGKGAESQSVVINAMALLVQQRSPDKVVRLLMSKHSVSNKRAYAAVRLAVELAKAGSVEYLESVGQTLLETLQILYRAAYKAEDFGVCLKVLQEIRTYLPTAEAHTGRSSLTVEFVHSEFVKPTPLDTEVPKNEAS